VPHRSSAIAQSQRSTWEPATALVYLINHRSSLNVKSSLAPTLTSDTFTVRPSLQNIECIQHPVKAVPHLITFDVIHIGIPSKNEEHPYHSSRDPSAALFVTSPSPATLELNFEQESSKLHWSFQDRVLPQVIIRAIVFCPYQVLLLISTLAENWLKPISCTSRIFWVQLLIQIVFQATIGRLSSSPQLHFHWDQLRTSFQTKSHRSITNQSLLDFPTASQARRSLHSLFKFRNLHCGVEHLATKSRSDWYQRRSVIARAYLQVNQARTVHWRRPHRFIQFIENRFPVDLLLKRPPQFDLLRNLHPPAELVTIKLYENYINLQIS